MKSRETRDAEDEADDDERRIVRAHVGYVIRTLACFVLLEKLFCCCSVNNPQYSQYLVPSFIVES